MTIRIVYSEEFAEWEGFEPPVPFPTRRVSNPVQSAALPPLHVVPETGVEPARARRPCSILSRVCTPSHHSGMEEGRRVELLESVSRLACFRGRWAFQCPSLPLGPRRESNPDFTHQGLTRSGERWSRTTIACAIERLSRPPAGHPAVTLHDAVETATARVGGGGRGIRTPEASFETLRFSRPPPSAARPFLHPGY